MPEHGSKSADHDGQVTPQMDQPTVNPRTRRLNMQRTGSDFDVIQSRLPWGECVAVALDSSLTTESRALPTSYCANRTKEFGDFDFQTIAVA